MRSDRSLGLFQTLLASLALPLAGLAQCPNTWQAVPGCPGVNDFVYGLTAYDPDGAGPLPTHVVVAGSFQRAGFAVSPGLALWNPTTSSFQNLPGPSLPFAGQVLFGPVAVRGTELLVACHDQLTNTSRVTSYDGTSWTTLGGNFQGRVWVLHPSANGEVLVGGSFTAAGSTSLPGYAVWNGLAWAADPGLSGVVQAIDELLNGDLLVAGSTNLGGVARRSGTTWSAVGSNPPAQTADVLGLPSGEILAIAADSVHRFDGVQWSQLAPPSWTFWNAPQRLLLTSTGTLFVGGFWSTLAGATTQVASLDVNSSQWTAIGLTDAGEIYSFVTEMLELPNSDLVVGGSFSKCAGLDVANVARFDSLGPHALADGPSYECTTAVALDGDEFVVGGSFRSFGNLPARGVAHWDGAAWGTLGTGLDGTVFDLVRLPDGSVVAGGDFVTTGAVLARSLARWSGTAWQQFGGVGPVFGSTTVHRLLPLANGHLLIGGNFSTIGGVPCNSLARWDGTSFAPIPGFPGTGASVRHLGEFPNGDLIVAGTNAIYRYRQASGAWLPFSSTVPVTGLNPSDTIRHLVVRRDGALAITTGVPGWPAGVLHLYSPSGSHQAIAVFGGIHGLHELPDGDLLVTGKFGSIGGIAANSAARIGSILPGAAALSAAPFDGSYVTTLVQLDNGDLLAVGPITSLDGTPAFGVAKLEPGCRPTSTSYGAGCSGSTGLNELRAKSLPWLGTTFSMQATGLPVNSLALAFVGLQAQSIPLPLATPLGTPGCVQLTSIDLESLQLTGNGVLDLELRIPDAPFLIGFVLHAQVAPLDFGPLGVTSTNALQLVIGDR